MNVNIGSENVSLYEFVTYLLFTSYQYSASWFKFVEIQSNGHF